MELGSIECVHCGVTMPCLALRQVCHRTTSDSSLLTRGGQMKWVVAAVACAGLALPADARPPPNADMTLAPWFQGLRQPRTGMSCCSIADCRPTDFRTNGSHYEAMVDGE